MENSPIMEHADGIIPRRRRVRPLPYALLLPAISSTRADARLPDRPPGAPCRCRSSVSKQQFGAAADWVGLRNFRAILHDAEFWAVLRRTVLFCAVNVVLTMVLGMAVALLLETARARRCGC